MQRSFTVLIDTREQNPLPLPSTLLVLNPNRLPSDQTSLGISLTHTPFTLKTGDYALAGHETTCVIERKGSIFEVAQNCLSGDRDRFVRSLVRLRDTIKYPYLLLEGCPAHLLMRDPCQSGFQPNLALDSLIRLLSEYRVAPLFMPTGSLGNRRAMGEWVCRLLVNHSMFPATLMPSSPDSGDTACPAPHP